MRLLTLWAAIFTGSLLALGQGATPSANPANTASEGSLSHDRHEGLNVAADPYTDPERAKRKFGKANPMAAGILPVEVFLSNELDQPIHIDLNTIRLEVHPPEGARQDIDSLSAAEVARTIVHPEGSNTPSTRRFPPIGIPSSGNDKKTESMVDILRPLALDADIVPPMGTIHGFLFFNVNHQMSLAEHASLYVPDAAVIPSNKPLMFFEVVLAGSTGR